MLTITFNLSGPLDRIKLPNPAVAPARTNRLWEHTCFELFFKVNGAAPYRECNFSPSGNWNLYRFDDYRTRMTEETQFDELPFSVYRESDAFTLAATLDIETIIPPDLPIQAAVSAVVESAAGNLSYWAFTHPGPKPDFHHPEGFILEV